MNNDDRKSFQLAKWASEEPAIRDYADIILEHNEKDPSPFYDNILRLLSWSDFPSFYDSIEEVKCNRQASSEKSSVEFYERWAKGFMYQFSTIAHALTFASEATLHDRVAQSIRLKSYERLKKAAASVALSLKDLELDACVRVEPSDRDESRGVPFELAGKDEPLTDLLDALVSRGRYLANTPGYVKSFDENSAQTRFVRKLDSAMSIQLNASTHSLVSTLTNMYFSTNRWNAKKVANTSNDYLRSIEANKTLRLYMSSISEEGDDITPRKLDAMWHPTNHK